MKIGPITTSCAAGHALVALGLALLAGAWIASATASGVASAAAPARISVQVPPAANDATVMMLELGVKLVRAPASGKLGAVVRIAHPGGAGGVEVGRLTLGPKASGEQRFQINVADAIARLKLSGGSGEVEVALIDRAGGLDLSGAQLTIGLARIVTR